MSASGAAMGQRNSDDYGNRYTETFSPGRRMRLSFGTKTPQLAGELRFRVRLDVTCGKQAA